MIKKLGVEAKVGIFAIVCLVIIGFATLKVSDRSIIAGGGYKMTVIMDSAIGVKVKTPVEIAGIQVGIVKKIKLDQETGRAKIILSIDRGVKLPEGTKAFVRAKGFLGQTLIELRLGTMANKPIPGDTEIPYGGVTGDVNLLLTQFNDIAADIKQVTGSLRDLMGPDESSPVYRTVHNMDKFSAIMKDITIRNEQNFNRIAENLAVLTAELRGVVESQRYELQDTIANINSITDKVDSGQGTLGKLVNDETTVNKLNSAVDNLNDTLGGLKRLETEIGYHMEYLGGTEDFKHYVHLGLMPAPDKAFLFDFISDPDASPTRTTTTTDITVGNNTSTVETQAAQIKNDEFRFSAQIAKKFYDFTVRGGVIESTGGVGFDYNRGPVGLHFSAFDFETKFGQKPHLKVMGNLNLTNSIYLVGGVDDFINPNHAKDWFFGAGIRFVDEDIKSLLGLGAKAFK